MQEKPMDENLAEEQQNSTSAENTEGSAENAQSDEVNPFEQGENIKNDTVSVKDERITALEAERDDLNQRLMRLQADFENFKRRTREEKARDRQFRALELITNILPVLDNFERALGTATEHEESKALQQGLEMVYRQLTEALIQEGVTKIEAVGQPFDPNKHQAVMQVESDEHESNMVVEVLQAGYELNGRVIRPSMVKVSQ